jgi:hypothetical protein
MVTWSPTISFWTQRRMASMVLISWRRIIDVSVGGEGSHCGIDVENVYPGQVFGDDGERAVVGMVCSFHQAARLSLLRSQSHALMGGARPQCKTLERSIMLRGGQNPGWNLMTGACRS